MTTLLLIVCSAGWLIALLPLAGAFISTVMSTAGSKQAGKKGYNIPYIAHITIFPVVILAIIGAWVVHFTQTGGAFFFLLLPLLNIIVFLGGMKYLDNQ